MNAAESAREAAALHLWDEGIVRPESAAFAVVDFLVREGHMTLSTPPADDVREALDAILRANNGYWPQTRDDILATFEVGPRGTVTGSEVEYRARAKAGHTIGEARTTPDAAVSAYEQALDSETFEQSDETPVVETRLVTPWSADVRLRGTVTDAEVEAAAGAICQAAEGEPITDIRMGMREQYKREARAALEPAREARS